MLLHFCALYCFLYVGSFLNLAPNTTVLLKLNVEAESAFKELKALLCKGIVLTTPQQSRISWLASYVSPGAIFALEMYGEEHPVVYLSQKIFHNRRGVSSHIVGTRDMEVSPFV